MAIAIRSEMHANRPDPTSLDIYLKLAFQGDQLPGYSRDWRARLAFPNILLLRPDAQPNR